MPHSFQLLARSVGWQRWQVLQGSSDIHIITTKFQLFLTMTGNENYQRFGKKVTCVKSNLSNISGNTYQLHVRCMW